MYPQRILLLKGWNSFFSYPFKQIFSPSAIFTISNIESYLRLRRRNVRINQRSSESAMGHFWICCRGVSLSTIYFITLIIQAVVIMQSTIFLLFNYLQGVEVYSSLYGDLKYVLQFHYLIPLIIVQISWFISAAGTIYSVQRIIPYLMFPHIFTSLFLLFAAILLISLTAYHITRSQRFNYFFVLLLLLPSLYSFGALYAIYLTLSCLRLLIHKRKSVSSISRKDVHKGALQKLWRMKRRRKPIRSRTVGDLLLL